MPTSTVSRDKQVDQVGDRLDLVHVLWGGLVIQVDLSLNSTRQISASFQSEKLLLR
ncbi:hypothetical protein P6U16_21845 (plasmid) [Rhizobium sp. 32-5/1]|uniref:hypothetical protein n=1 Tax=Rhizobium sp. 32-5/1 TaxID=3019602 RepID=UPI00240CECF1|nr:hypothetical protein [Rhizobium sp. 32-5/1]WEZ85708.1 hypothetical protein P6U16_21845 [Rhizobium sp. 32-5/1]